MRWQLKPSLFLVALFLSFVSGCDRTNPESLWAEQAYKRVASDYQALNAAAGQVVSGAGEFCQGAQELEFLQAQWVVTMQAWQRVQWVRFGPIMADNDDWKIQFWPDKKNIVARKISQILADSNPISEATIANASVVVQGLSALELLLFDPAFLANYRAADAIAQRQCQLLVSIAQRLQTTTTKIAQGWQSETFQDLWLASVKEDDPNAHASAVTDVVNSLLAEMERVKLDKLGGPIGYKNRNHKPNGYFSESWRSKTSFLNIKSNLESAAVLLNDPKTTDGYDLAALLGAKGHGTIAQEIKQQIDVCLTMLDGFTAPLSEVVVQQENQEALAALYGCIGELNSTLKSKLATGLGITLGFNANDGD